MLDLYETKAGTQMSTFIWVSFKRLPIKLVSFTMSRVWTAAGVNQIHCTEFGHPHHTELGH